MTIIDIHFCEMLLKKVGKELHEKCKQWRHPSSSKDLFSKFNDVNNWATNQLRTALNEKYPYIQWSHSEFAVHNQEKPEFEGEYWICDSIDGAIQFLQGISAYTISLCLIRDGQPVLACIYEPCNQDFFHATQGEGAFLNGEKINVGVKEGLADALITTTPPSNPNEELAVTNQTIKGFEQLIPKAFAIRMLGSVSLQLAYVACGRIDGYYEFGTGIYDWLAGALIVKEAGGHVTDIQGRDFIWGSSGVIAANKKINSELEKELKDVK